MYVYVLNLHFIQVLVVVLKHTQCVSSVILATCGYVTLFLALVHSHNNSSVCMTFGPANDNNTDSYCRMGGPAFNGALQYMHPHMSYSITYMYILSSFFFL